MGLLAFPRATPVNMQPAAPRLPPWSTAPAAVGGLEQSSVERQDTPGPSPRSAFSAFLRLLLLLLLKPRQAEHVRERHGHPVGQGRRPVAEHLGEAQTAVDAPRNAATPCRGRRRQQACLGRGGSRRNDGLGAAPRELTDLLVRPRQDLVPARQAAGQLGVLEQARQDAVHEAAVRCEIEFF